MQSLRIALLGAISVLATAGAGHAEIISQTTPLCT